MNGFKIAETSEFSTDESPSDQMRMTKFTSAVALTYLPIFISFCLFVTLSWTTLTWWWYEYTRDESYYSHGPFIPFMAGFIVWQQRNALAKLPRYQSNFALLLLLPALTLLIFSQKLDMRALQSVGVITVFWGMVWFVLGKAIVRAIWFPLLFLVLMMPLPGPLLNDATLTLQMWSTTLASHLLSAIGFANTHLGNIIKLSRFELFVDVPCSGFKTLLALFSFNAFLAASLDGAISRRIVLFALCAPLSLVINGVRIALIGIVGNQFGMTAALRFHDYSGLITLTLGFIGLFGIAKLLGCKTFAGLAIF